MKVALNVLKLNLIMVGLLGFAARTWAESYVISCQSWIDACEALPKNRILMAQGVDAQQALNSALVKLTGSQGRAQKAFLKQLKKFEHSCRSVAGEHLWVNSLVPAGKLQGKMFAQKIILKDAQRIFVQGDLHGDIHSLIAFIKQLQADGQMEKGSFKLKPHTYLLFLGDYVDRGFYGLEVMCTLLWLKNYNPDQVVLVRGNHEDPQIAQRCGFYDELEAKLGSAGATAVIDQLIPMYECLPVVCYLGSQNFIQCCHGGLEVGYKPTALLDDQTKQYELIKNLNRGDFFAACPHLTQHMPQGVQAQGMSQAEFQNTPLTGPIMFGADGRMTNLGYMWGDLQVSPSAVSKYRTGRGLCASKVLTESCLQGLDPRVRWIFRAHQHSANPADPMMQGLLSCNGLYRLWQAYETAKKRSLVNGGVFTFNVAPDSVYGEACGFNYMTYGEVVAHGPAVENWDLFVHNIMVF